MDVDIVCGSSLFRGCEEEAGEGTSNFSKNIFDEAIEPAAFLGICQRDEVGFVVDKLGFFRAQRGDIMKPIANGIVVAG